MTASSAIQRTELLNWTIYHPIQGTTAACMINMDVSINENNRLGMRSHGGLNKYEDEMQPIMPQRKEEKGDEGH